MNEWMNDVVDDDNTDDDDETMKIMMMAMTLKIMENAMTTMMATVDVGSVNGNND